ncbi:calcium/sodium antiporter [Testudinibacter sp. TR-2022]|uniref:calcium/sodium antiporter n=1 Tax=Testudinibacter sp. TR-2022 TaxID=2585029 RepID=UPI001117C47B|nr:calcium/sodium antiporter [Testudinibacter sp. TR-2022]TNH05495.1 calcium/sodium antiporter [Pasteurellaceae bacterium Phil31]TNH11218.1 calcium/sodium antiporter [Testudinibacter sp. TR-2022]TNH11905.1 calcium/sodium antiporter [Testudinibacter sp. TR-2022]TNH12563.1 calcium/sodium antiporter [Testudinibacter sp. TR-2022]TNH14767.1 calcium/sodium antiporter [Testudinibacter sp. TR-2022]
MLLACCAIIIGLILLVWSADKFVDGASETAQYFGMPKLLIGMLVIGFGTSAPEIVVSVTSAIQGNPGIALGNAYGSNIANIALILGITALISPVLVAPSILKKELPLLLAVTLVSAGLLFDRDISRFDGIIILLMFAIFMFVSIRDGLKVKSAVREQDADENRGNINIGKAIGLLLFGLIVLVLSSQLLVWGAVTIANHFGVSQLVIGLTIVAVGTSLPELASSIAAARKNQHDLALGNIIGSNLFNTLAVVGLAATIHPLQADHEIITRDMPMMLFLTAILFIFGYRYQNPNGYIKRWAGLMLLLCYIAYNSIIFMQIAG